MTNMRSYIIRFSFICSVLIFLFFFQNCIDVGMNFSTIENELVQESALPQPETPINEVHRTPAEIPTRETRRTHSETFIGETRRKAVDMVWVVDNSPSMGEEAAHVRYNLRSFINTLESSIDIKVTLLSKIIPDSSKNSPKTHVHLPVSALMNGHMQLEQYINSFDSLVQLSAYLPPLASIAFRKDSQKVFVFVTDDNSNIPYSDFISTYQEIFPNELPIVYGFIGLETRELSPCMVSPISSKRDGAHGAEYKQLSNMTGGEIYNICDSDWSQHFSTLANSVIEKTITSFTLEKKRVQKILDLKIDGQTIDSNFYQIVDDRLKIDPSLVNQRNQYSIDVTYVY